MDLNNTLTIFTYVALLVVLLLVVVCGVAFVFYWLSERSHRFDVNTMSNQDKLLRDSLELNQSLLREINSNKEPVQRVINTPLDLRTSFNNYQSDGLPDTTPQVGG